MTVLRTKIFQGDTEGNFKTVAVHPARRTSTCPNEPSGKESGRKELRQSWAEKRLRRLELKQERLLVGEEGVTCDQRC